MRIEHWIALATMVATLVGPVFAVWLQKRLERSATKLATSQPKRRNLFIRLVASQGLTLIIASVSIVFVAYSLLRELNSSQPITRSSVFTIALFTGTILYQLVVSLFALTVRELIRVQRTLVDSFEHVASTHSDIVDSQERLVEAVERYEARPPKTKPRKRSP